MRNKIKRIIGLKSKRKLVCLTAYSKPIAKILDNYCDMILVGDSMATAFYGMENTKSISLKTIINHSIAVKKGTSKSTLVVDMPINITKAICEKMFIELLNNKIKIKPPNTERGTVSIIING